MKRILVNHNACSGCRACEVACVVHHEGQFGTFNTRIRVSKIEPLGVEYVHICRLCRRAPCVISCPSNALFRDKATDAVLLLHEECIGCSECVDACPFGMASLHPSSGLTLICDLCRGDPACVKRCATGAIVYTDEEAGPGKKRQDIAVRSTDNSSSRTSDHE